MWLGKKKIIKLSIENKLFVVPFTAECSESKILPLQRCFEGLKDQMDHVRLQTLSNKAK